MLVLGLVLTLLAGCEESKYPASLRYPQRADLLVKDPPSTDFRKPMPGPGQLDESIRKAARENIFQSVDPAEVGKAERDELRTALEELFGTPAQPSVEPADPERMSGSKKATAQENQKLYQEALGTNLQSFDVAETDVDQLFIDSESLTRETGSRSRTLARGSQLYRRHCLHCHGVAGDGRGPTGPWVSPHPRDYRQGTFKFLSTNLQVVGTGKPRKDDLLRTLEKGLDGTSMPAFGLLPRRELEQMVSYVIHLSIRGQVEYDTLYALVKNRPAIDEKGGVKGFAYNQAAVLTAQWALASKLEMNKPPAYPHGDDTEKDKVEASIRRGHQLFLGKGLCITCHLDYGRQSANRYDTWGTMVRPRNLTEGNYRGGRRPIDLFWRLSGGIPPSGMSKLPPTTTPEEAWDLINFVQALPYPAMLPRDVRDKIYGPAEAKKPSVAQANP